MINSRMEIGVVKMMAGMPWAMMFGFMIPVASNVVVLLFFTEETETPFYNDYTWYLFILFGMPLNVMTFMFNINFFLTAAKESKWRTYMNK